MNALKEEQRAKRASEAIALFRRELEEKKCEVFTIKELQAGLARNKCPYVTPNLLTEFIKKNIIVSTGRRGEYVFKGVEPVYFKTVASALDSVVNYYKKKVSTEKSYSEKFSEADAIAFLKEKGYKIKKPIVSYEDI